MDSEKPVIELLLKEDQSCLDKVVSANEFERHLEDSQQDLEVDHA